MPRIEFAKKNRPAIEVPEGANLMQALLGAGLPVASSCSGDGVCAKCRIQIHQGPEKLSPRNDTEAFLAERFNLKKDIRISCQVTVPGDLVIDASYW